MKTLQQSALLTAMNAGKLDSQGQQNLIFKILNGSNEELKSEIKSTFFASEFDGLNLSDEQNLKRFNWLKNLWLTPKGVERKNNPFGYREQDALENFSHITLKGFYDAGNYHHTYYIPMYDVYTKDGYGFEHYVSGGEINITG